MIAIDEDGNTYDIPDIGISEEVVFNSIEGVATITTEQDKYEDGTYARSEREIRTFEFN
jgi:hypothetical protein